MPDRHAKKADAQIRAGVALSAIVVLPIAIGFAILAGISYWTVNGVRINGAIYNKIIDDKDLVADILPPPAYIVEAHLLAHQMLVDVTPQVVGTDHLKVLDLERQFNERHAFWIGRLEGANVRQTFLIDSAEPGRQYYRLYRESFHPLLLAGDRAAATAVLNGPMRDAYEAHRHAIDRTVGLAHVSAEHREAESRQLIRNRIIIMALAVVGLLLLTGTINVLVLRRTLRVSRALRESEESYRRQFCDNNAVMLLVDSDGRRILDANAAAERFYGYPQSTLLRLSMSDLQADPTTLSTAQPDATPPLNTGHPGPAHPVELHRPHLAAGTPVQTGGQAVLTTGEPIITRHRTRDQGNRDIEMYNSLIRLQDRPVLHAIIHDVTERRRLESELVVACREARAASVAKSEFLANMSHEIRTPMTAILGFTDLLSPTSGVDLSTEQRDELVSTIQRNGLSLLAILNDILDLSKIEAGKMTVETLDFDPASAVEEVVSLMGVRARGKGIDLVLNYTTPLPRAIQSDPVRLRQILLNLVGNAIKFTEKGAVNLSVSASPPGQSPPWIDFTVTDTGIGMTESECARLFEAFSQADTSTTRRFGGTGLGLKISMSLAQILGGNISVTSTPGQGSSFKLRVSPGDLSATTYHHPAVRPPDPLTRRTDTPDAHLQSPTQPPPEGLAGGQSAAHDPAIAAAALPRSLSGLRLLLAEDGPDNQKLISFHLRRAGAEVEIVGNGQLALSAVARAGDQGRPFDVVLMDMQMPEIDGITAVRELRDRGYSGPIIALTAHAMEADRTRSIEAGCNEHLTKPIDRTALLHACARWGHSNAVATPPTARRAAN